ncbi:MAG: type IV secretion system protein [Zoogloeaceae bacterium]|jgi:type IV secretion system protein VirB5|nr:type IV secretion system protein [Zoogloeaceae bacterium]
MKASKFLIALAFCVGVYAPMAGAHIASTVMNHIENIAKWVEQAQQMQEQIEEMQKQYEANTGERGMGGIPDNLREQLKNVIANPPGWEEQRRLYPTFEGLNAPKAAAVYDVVAKGDARFKALQDLAQQRLDQVNSLMQRIDSAEDPAAKQDLLNRIASEQAAIQAAESLMQVVAKKQETEVRQAEIAAQREFFEREWK